MLFQGESTLPGRELHGADIFKSHDVPVSRRLKASSTMGRRTRRVADTVAVRIIEYVQSLFSVRPN
jgi:hypothetical protein